MSRTIYKSHFVYILIHIILSLIMFGISIFTWDMSIMNLDFTKFISIGALVLLSIQLITFYKLKIKFIDLRYMFIILLYIFLLGRIFVHGFKLPGEYELFFYRYTYDELYKSSIFCLAFIEMFFLGSIFANNKNVNISKVSVEYRFDRVLFHTGLFILIFSLPFELYYKYTLLMTQMFTNAYVGGGSVGTNGIIIALSRMPTVGIISIISSKVLSKKYILRLSVIFLLYEMTLSVFTGERGFTILSAITLVICTINLYKIKIKLPQLILFGSIGYITIALLATIGTIRTSAFNVTTFFKVFIEKLSGSTLTNFLAEFGNTQNTIGMAIKYISETTGLFFGSTFLFSFLSIIPGLYRFFPNASLLFNPIDIITKINPGFYFGGSIVLDSYINFGHIFGLMFGTVYGLIIMFMARIHTVGDETSVNKTYALYYIKYYILLRMVRCGFSEIIRIYIYALVIFYLVYTLINSRANKLMGKKHSMNITERNEKYEKAAIYFS